MKPMEAVMRRNRDERGMTLIEILLSLIILVLGMVGILALFPAALQQSVESVEDTSAGMVAESVAHALATGMRFSNYNSGTQQWEVVLSHDLGSGTSPNVTSNSKSKYTFALPKLPIPLDPSKEWFHYPSDGPPPNPLDSGKPVPISYEPEKDTKCVFNLAVDDWAKATTDKVKNEFDNTDAYGQFGFAFDIRNVSSTLEYKLSLKNPGTGNNYTVAEIQPDCKMYEFRIYVFRVGTTAGSFSGGGGTGTVAGGGDPFQKLVAILTKRITLK